MTRGRWIILLVVSLLVGGVVGGAASGAPILAPLRAPLSYPWSLLAEEAQTMNDCAECHEVEDFHSCRSCHDEHGSAELASVPFDDLILLTGDVPRPDYIAVNEILPYRDQPGTHVRLLDFLAGSGARDFESVTLTSRDGGFVTLDPGNLTEEAVLLPHTDGVRFAAENLHVSTWLKGVWRIIVVAKDRPLTVDGRATSMGRLLLGPTRYVTIQQTDVMLKSESDGQIRKAKTASRIEGAGLDDIVGGRAYEELVVLDAAGKEHRLAAEDAEGAVLAQLRDRPEVVLVLPERGRSQWVSGVVDITPVR